MYYKKILLCFFLPIISLVSLALDPKGPLALSMSGSGRATSQSGAEYHLINPAGVMYSSGFSSGAYYMFAVAKKQKPVWGVSLSETRQFPLALSYIKERYSEEQYMSVSTAGFIVPGWSLGLSLSRWQTDQDTNWNIQAGVLVKPSESSFSLGATWDHILPLEGAFEKKRKWGLGLEYKFYEGFFLRADAFYNENTRWLTAGGIKATFNDFLILRLSTLWHLHQKTILFSGGIGLETKHISLDYGLSEWERRQTWLHTINVRFSL